MCCFADNHPNGQPSSLKVFYTDHADVSEDIIDRLLSKLSDDEYSKAIAFKDRKAKVNYVASHYFLHRCLKHEFGVNKPLFACNDFGKPYLDSLNNSFCSAPWTYNLSHSENLTAVAVGPYEHIGVDIEKQADFGCPHSIIRSHFSNAEQECVLDSAPNDQSAAFLKIWVMKEAVSKATGFGLRLPFSEFCVVDGRPSFSSSLQHLVTTFHTWTVQLREFTNGFVAFASANPIATQDMIFVKPAVFWLPVCYVDILPID